MTPQELKNSILQLAIQGKLVEQRADEGTGAELLEKILAAKNAEGAKVGARVPRDRKGRAVASRPPIPDDEKPFEIPESWEWVRLGELCSIATGRRDANFGSPDGKYNFFTCAKNPIKCHSFSFTGESLLLAGNGDIGNITYFWGQFEAYQRTYVLHPYLEGSYLIYLYYHLQSNWVQYNTGMVYGTAIPYIRLGNVQNYLVALPPLAEQKRIVAKIEELMPLIDCYEKAWSRLEDFNKRFPVDMQKSLLQMAIQGKLVEQRAEEGTGAELLEKIFAAKNAKSAKKAGVKSHAKSAKSAKIGSCVSRDKIPDDEKPFDIPESWEWARLGEVVDVRDGTHDTPKYVQAGVPLVTSKNLVSGTIDFTTAKFISYEDSKAINIRSGVDDGDVLFAMIGTIGNPVLIRKDREFSIKNMALFKPIDRGLFCMEYLMMFLTKAQLDMRKSASASVQSFVSLSFLRNYPIPLPPLAEQKRIVAKLEELLPLCERLK